MKKTGGILAIVAGVLGLFAAVFTLVIGGWISVVGFDPNSTVIWMEFSGILFCSLLIILGTKSIHAKSYWPGLLIIASSILGAYMSGSFVSILMIITLIGGVISCLDDYPVIEIKNLSINNLKSNSELGDYFIGGFILIFFLIIAFNPKIFNTSKDDVKQSQSNDNNYLLSTIPEDIEPKEIATIFSVNSDYTKLQKDIKLEEIKGKVVEWTLPIKEIEAIDSGYLVTITPGLFGIFDTRNINANVYLATTNPNDDDIIKSIKPDDFITFKGIIKDVNLGTVMINPAIFIKAIAKGEAEPESDSSDLISNYQQSEGTTNLIGDGESRSLVSAKNQSAETPAELPFNTEKSIVDLQEYLQKHPSDVIDDSILASKFREILNEEYTLLKMYIGNKYRTPDNLLEMDSNYYLGFSCTKICTSNEAAFAISKENNNIYVIVIDDQKGTKFYGVDTLDELPAKLQSWYKSLDSPTPF